MIHKSNRMLSITILIFSIFILVTGITYAQGKIVGKIVEQKTREPLFGASIILVGTNTGAPSDPEGDYIIVNVPVGVYSVQASMVGTTKVTKTNVIVSQGQTTRVDFELLETAVLNQEMVVTAKQDILHKEVSSSQIVITKDQIGEAAGVRTLQDFLSTQAGITNSDYLNIRGGRPSETGTMVNGLTYVNARVGKAESFIPTSAVEQVSLKAGGMNAEYGDFRSGLISVTTKTGTKSGYHGTFSFTQGPAQMKRFGKSIYDPMNNYLRPHQDPDIAFIGVTEAINQGFITAYDKQQFPTYSAFTGFITAAKNLPAGWKASLKPGETVTPVNIYLYDSWMHMINPDFDKLNAKIRELNAKGLNVGAEITDQNLKNLFRNHANKEGKYADFNFDGGFGGPIPLISEELGDATFYISNTTNRNSYIQPQELDYNLSSSTMLSLKSDLTSNITLKLTGIYGYQKGMNPARGADSEPANLAIATGLTGVYTGLDRGNFMPENNIPLYIASGGNYAPGQYWYYQTMLQPWIQKNLLLGLNLTHALSSTSFYEFTGSYQTTKENINPDLSTPRNNSVLAYLGPIPLTEMPYGRRILNVGQSVDTIAGWQFDQYYAVPGLSSDRFDSKGGVYYDNSLTKQLRLKLNFGSQISKMHYMKAGVEFLKVDLENKRWSYWPTQGPLSMYEYNFDVSPRTIGAYVQDEITFEDMVANIGVRMDYYSFGDAVWPTGNPWDGDAFAAPSWTPSDYLEILKSGRSIIWEHWNQLNDQYVAAGKDPLLQPVATHITFSPRFGISFPITERAKFYFNYGHFRSLPPLSEMFMYDFRYDTQKGGIAELGNPNLSPSKTIQYELGVDYNLFDEYLVHIAGYYKDITGEVRTLTYNPTTAGIARYRFRTNDSYRATQGLDVQITKAIGSWVTGWLNVGYTYTSGGNTGRNGVFQDEAANIAPSAFSYADPGRPDPVPQIKANINFKSPADWGYFLGGWNLSLMPNWKVGDLFRYNPRNVDGANNEFRWPNFFLVNMKISKTFDIGLFKATAYIDINNIFDTKIFNQNYAFAGGGGSAGGTDYQAYMSSLHLKEYSDSYYEPIRNETKGDYLYPGYVYTANVTDQWGVAHNKGDVVGEDKIGDLRSTEKNHINDPNVDVFMFGNPRAVWFGIQFDF
ncbi:MAG: TonB-dependent receptor [Stygiobacter sp.]|nr:MAG: TonB-dependent receptor [Stygiobacter sp.]